MRLSGPKHANLEDIPSQDGSGQDDSNDMRRSSASKLKALLEKRKWTVSKSQGEVQSNDVLVEDLANLLHESDLFTKQLEDQIGVYQDSLAGLRLRTEQVVSENEMLYKRLQETSPARNTSALKFGQNEDRKSLYQLENELDEVKRLNQDKTDRLETIIKSTREELDIYRGKVSKLQSQLRDPMHYESEKKADSICLKCGGLSYFSAKPSVAEITTLDKVTRERDELSETLAKHKSLLEQCQQREFEAYMEVKKCAETAENANLEKAEAIIKIKQLENSLDEERKRHEALVFSTSEKWKRECDSVRAKFEQDKETLQIKIQGLTGKSDENDQQLDNLTREKVTLISDLEKSKAELAVCRVDIDKIKEESREEIIAITRERVKIQQELDNVKNIQSRQLKKHEQVKISLTTENEALNCRLAEAQSNLLETREENLRTEEKLKRLQNELHLLTLSKANVETAHEENREYFKKQEKQREQQFLETIQDTENKHAELRRELEELLQAQMKMSSALKDENKRLILKLEEKKENCRSEKAKWREQVIELTNEVETTRKQHDEFATERENISRINDELAGKVKLLKRENKRSLKMIYNLLKKQKDLMQDRQTLCHQFESLQKRQFAGSLLQRHSQEAGKISTNEQESDVNTSRNDKQSNIEVNDDDESL